MNPIVKLLLAACILSAITLLLAYAATKRAKRKELDKMFSSKTQKD